MQEKLKEANIEKDDISLKEVLNIINDWSLFFQKKLRLILLIGLLGAIVGSCYSLLSTPTYSATITFAMEDDKGGAGISSGAAGIASQFGIDMGSAGGGAFSGSNIIELMKSKRIVRSTLLENIDSGSRKMALADLYLQIAKETNAWRSVSKIPLTLFKDVNKKTTLTLYQDSVLQIIHDKITSKNLSIQQKDKKVSIITLTVNSTNQIFSKIFAEVLARETSNLYIETKSKKAKINVEILQKQSDSIREKLNEAISGVASNADNVFNLNPAFNLKKTPTTKRQIDVQSNTTILNQLLANLEISKVNLRKETPLIQIIDSPTLPLVKNSPNFFICIIAGFLIFSFAIIFYLVVKKLILDELNSEKSKH